jgi:hypothetical protein
LVYASVETFASENQSPVIQICNICRSSHLYRFFSPLCLSVRSTPTFKRFHIQNHVFAIAKAFGILHFFSIPRRALSDDLAASHPHGGRGSTRTHRYINTIA